jgi:PBP1b-binding outer membrane lipoprotein LpoB
MKKVILYITVLTLIAMFTGCAQPPGSDGTEPETKEIGYETVLTEDLGDETVEKIESVKHKKVYAVN